MVRKRIGPWLVALAAAGALVGAAATPAGAVEPHQHHITTPGGVHDIARGFCHGEFGSTETQNVALANFHMKIHLGPQGPSGTVTVSALGCA